MNHLSSIVDEVQRCYPGYFTREQAEQIVALCEACHWMIVIHAVVRAIQAEAEKRLPPHIHNIR